MNTDNKKEPFDPLFWSNLNNNQEASEPQTLTSSSPSLPANHNTDAEDIEAQVCEITQLITSRGIDITGGYTNWLNLGFSLADGLGEAGRQFYHDLSRMNSGYDTADCDKQYNACLRSHRSGVTIRTFFMMAKDAGIDIREVAREHISINAGSATPAKAPSANNTVEVGNNAVFGTFESGMADGGMAKVAETTPTQGSGYTFSDKLIVEEQSELMRTVYDLHGKEPAKCDAQMIAALNSVGGLMGGANGSPEQRSGIYGIYDGRRVYAPHYNIVYSGAGNDKGNLIFCKFLLYAVKCEMRRKYEAEKQEYEQQLAEWEAQGKKERSAPPKEPVYRDPFVPGNSSSSAVYRAIDANGGWGMLFETEADTISSMIDSDYGNYSDLMRKAHHHETLSMNRVTDKVHIEVDEPRLSIFLTCTPGQLPALFPSFENGLGSRFLFYNTPDEEVEFHDVFAMRDTPLEDTYKRLGEDLLPLYHALQQRAGHPIQFVMSQSQQREFIETYSGILHEQFKMLGKGIRAFVFRIALECFRYAMILTTLRRLSDWRQTFNPSASEPSSIFSDDENALVCDDRDFRTAMTIIGCLINHTARVYAVMAKEDDNPFALKGVKLTADELKVYRALPEGNFRTSDFIETAAQMNIAERTAQRMLSQFCNVYRIVCPVRHGIYNKPVKPVDSDANQ